MFRNQFILSKKEVSLNNWQKLQILDYELFVHPDLDFTYYLAEDKSIYLLGNTYDWENTEYSNHKICEILTKKSDNIDDLITNSARYTGGFVIVAVFYGNLFVFHDACGQNEVYYHANFKSFASQPKLIEQFENTSEHIDLSAREFYNSEIFLEKRIFVGNSTHRAEVSHLMPNHYINAHSKAVCRYFPNEMLEMKSIDQVAQQSKLMIKGYLKSMAARTPIAVAVTAGYDSRILFLASLGLESKYFIDKHANVSNKHHDLTISKELVALYNQKFYIISGEFEKKPEIYHEYVNSIDFPRRPKASVINFPGHVYVNGNISEIARNYYGYHKNLTGKELCYLYGYDESKYPAVLYCNWLQSNSDLFDSYNYNYLDLFYWEERMGNWASKSKTESLAIGKKVISPFNSRSLITLLLSVKRKYRDSHYNVLYDKIIDLLAEGDTRVKGLPVNPCTRTTLIKSMKRLHIYNFYRYLGLKYKFLN